MNSQLSLFTLPTCPCGMGPYVHEDEVGLWCACGVEQWADASGYLDWLAAGPVEPKAEPEREAA